MSRLCIAGPSVVHEAIEGEVIIVNLDKGLYFSTDGVGASIWAMIVAGRTADEILLWATDALDAGDVVTVDVTEFLDDLSENELIRRPRDARRRRFRPAGGAGYLREAHPERVRRHGRASPARPDPRRQRRRRVASRRS